MESYKYWLTKEFICPVKTATFDMVHDWPVHGLAWSVIAFRDWLTSMNNLWGPGLAFLGGALSVSLLLFRVVTALVALYKAIRDRKEPEQKK